MIKFFTFVFLLLLSFTTIETRRDKTQIFLERRVSNIPDRRNLVTNESFVRELFDQFCLDHPRWQRKVSNETQRFQSFQSTFVGIVEHENQPKQTFTVGLNKFSDWMPSELEILRGTKPPPSDVRAKFVTMTAVSGGQRSTQKKTSQTTVSATFDYTTRLSSLNNVSIIRPVRDQGQCGSCYAFAMITLVEAQYAFHFGQAVNMSDQQIVDCSTGDFGCIGGYFDTSFNYLNSNNWYMNSATTYPYKAVQSNCSATKTGGFAAGNLVYRHLTAGNATAMQEALINFGPLWISLYIGSDCSGSAASSCPVKPSAAKKIMNTFQSYTGGIFQATGCVTSDDNNNHAMVIVGYGYDAATKLNYWKLRNSWGEEWGEDGYIRIRRGVNMCNVESDAFFLAKPVA